MNKRPVVLGGSALLSREANIVRPSIADYATEPLLQRIKSILDSNMVTNGPTVRQLEEAMAAYLEVEHVVAVSSCTLGQTLAIQAAGIHDTKVIVPSFTIAATANAVFWNRCTPVFVDIDLQTFNLSTEHLEELVSEEIGAVMPVHVFGNPCPIQEVQSIAGRHEIPVLYDAAQGFGAKYQGRRLGGFGKLEVFSGSPTKHFTSMEGGFVATNDAHIAELVRLTRNYEVLPSYDCVLPGLNARMPEINAAVGLSLLPDVDQFIVNRNRYAGMYQQLLGEVPGIRFQKITPEAHSSYNYLGLMVEPSEFGLTNRELAEALKAERVYTKVYYHPPVHQQTAYREVAGQTLPNTEYLADRIICLPLYNQMEDSLIEGICLAMQRIHRYHREVREALAGSKAGV